MSAGLAFETIAALFGQNGGIIDRRQFSLLVTVVVPSAVVPTSRRREYALQDSNLGEARSCSGR